MRIVLIVLCCMVVFSCKQRSTETKSDVSKKAEVIKISETDSLSKLTTSTDTNPKIVFPKGVIQVIGDDNRSPALKVKILNSGYYAAADAPQIKATLPWKGIFEKNGHFYIKETRIKVSKEKQGEDNSEDPGVNLNCDNTDKCKLFISGGDILTGPLKSIRLVKNELQPGQKEEFKYNGIKYIFYATGFKTDTSITNFKLYLTTNVKGHDFNQFLYKIPDYVLKGRESSDQQGNLAIEFISDIDNDNIPDFVITEHGTYSATTMLFLSKSAGNRAIVEHVASVTFNQ